ncbi:MAG: glycosyltransferase family 4 protein, partial [Oceanihabitans sp.]
WHWSSDFSEPLAAKIAGIPWVFTKKSMGWGNKAWKWRSALSTKIITINSDMNAFYASKIKRKVVAIPLGVDINYYSPSNTLKAASLHIIEKKPTDFFIVSVVNLIPIKGIEVLIQAVIALNNPNVKLLIVGNDQGDYANKLKKQASGFSTIQFLGKKADVRPYHAIADVFVIPTLKPGEGLPVAPLEAMASGKIVLGSKVSGVKDILKDFPDCLFEPNNVSDLKTTILRIMDLNETAYIQLEKSMHACVTQEYSVKQFIDKHTLLYKNIIAE